MRKFITTIPSSQASLHYEKFPVKSNIFSLWPTFNYNEFPSVILNPCISKFSNKKTTVQIFSSLEVASGLRLDLTNVTVYFCADKNFTFNIGMLELLEASAGLAL